MAHKIHALCKGDCPCQHHTDDGEWIQRNKKAPTPKREG